MRHVLLAGNTASVLAQGEGAHVTHGVHVLVASLHVLVDLDTPDLAQLGVHSSHLELVGEELRVGASAGAHHDDISVDLVAWRERVGKWLRACFGVLRAEQYFWDGGVFVVGLLRCHDR